MAKPYDATKEHAPVDKTTRLKESKGRHPNKGKAGKPPSAK